MFLASFKVFTWPFGSSTSSFFPRTRFLPGWAGEGTSPFSGVDSGGGLEHRLFSFTGVSPGVSPFALLFGLGAALAAVQGVVTLFPLDLFTSSSVASNT